MKHHNFKTDPATWSLFAAIMLTSFLVNWPALPIYNVIAAQALTIPYLFVGRRLLRSNVANIAVLLPIGIVYLFYTFPICMAPQRAEMSWFLPEWIEGEDYIYATLSVSAVVICFVFAYTKAVLSAAGAPQSKDPEQELVATICGVVGAVCLGLALLGAWMLREFFTTIFASTELFNVRWALHEGEAGSGRWRMLTDFAAPGGVLVGVYAARKRPLIAGLLLLVASVIGAVVVAPFLGRLVLAFATLAPFVGYLYARGTQVMMEKLLLVAYMVFPVVIVYTFILRGLGSGAADDLLERIMYADLGRLYAAAYLPYAKDFSPSLSYATADLAVFASFISSMQSGSTGSGPVTSLEAFSTLVTGAQTTHVVPGFLGSFVMYGGLLIGGGAAILAGYLLGVVIGFANRRRGSLLSAIGLLISVFASRTWIPHSNSNLLPLMYVYLPVVSLMLLLYGSKASGTRARYPSLHTLSETNNNA